MDPDGTGDVTVISTERPQRTNSANPHGLGRTRLTWGGEEARQLRLTHTDAPFFFFNPHSHLQYFNLKFLPKSFGNRIFMKAHTSKKIFSSHI